MSRQIKILFTEADRETLQPVLEALRAKGLRVTEAAGELRKDDTVLAALSGAFYADEKAMEKLLSLIGAGAENVLPLQMDSALMPDTLKNAIYSRNIIPGSERSAEQIAERVVAALPQKKSSLPKVLLLAGVALLAVVGLLIWRTAQNKTPVPEALPDEITIPVALGLTEEELAEVRCVAIIGDHFEYYKAEDKQRRDDNSSQWRDMLEDLGSAQFREDTGEFDWYWNEDGTQVSMAAYDLRFLSLMPNLEELHMGMVDVEQAPDLSELKKLNVIWAYDCRMDDLVWMARSNASKLQLRCHTDYAPLSESEALRVAILDCFNDTPTDFSSFSPKHLQEFDLNGWNLDRIDLSGLSACDELQRVSLGSVPVRDLSFLDGKARLTDLQLNEMEQLRDISALRSLTGLRSLSISPAERINDLSPIGGCTSLVNILLDTHEGRIRDVSFLRDLTKLEVVSLYGADLQNLDFLEMLGQQHRALRLAVEGICDDWSALSAVDIYQCLELGRWDDENLENILPHLENVTIRDFILRRFSGVDLSKLPRITERLELDRCDVEDLSTMPEKWDVDRLNLNKCSSLRSLDGLQNQNTIGNGGNLEVFQCPRLTDWNALEGMKLNSLRITGCYSLPSFENLSIGELYLESVADVKDLDFLEGLDTSRNCSFSLVGMDELTNIAPLSRFHGQFLAVSPQLQEQAEDLVEAGNFREYRIEYPEGGWEMDNMNFALLSMEELDTLPPALLRRVNRLCLAGDQIVDSERFEVWDDWEHRDAQGHPSAILHNRETGDETPVKPGSVTDLSRFSGLTGLHELKIYAQPLLTSLDGVQAFSELEWLEISYCYDLEDASPVFALQGLRGLQLRHNPISSIQGVQNLTELKNLTVSSTEVSDISPLKGCDFSRAYDEGGLWLGLGGTHIQDFSPLASVRKIEKLDVNAYDSTEWLDAVADTEILGIDCHFENNEALAAFVKQHPEMEDFNFSWSEQVTDLTPLLELENLQHVKVSRNMDKAIDSLNGQSYQFELEIDG